MRHGGLLSAFLLAALWASAASAADEAACPSYRAEPVAMADPALCAELAAKVHTPSTIPLDEYQTALKCVRCQLLPPRCGDRLGPRQVPPPDGPAHRHAPRRQLVVSELRDPCAGRGLVLGRHGGLASHVAERRGAVQGRPTAARRRHHRQGDVPEPDRLLPEPRSGASLPRHRVRDHGAGCRRLAGRLVLRLLAERAVHPRLAAARRQPAARHGLRPVLHELPRLGRDVHLRLAREHSRRAGRAAALPVAGLRRSRAASAHA
jgi:hypothetical protein